LYSAKIKDLGIIDASKTNIKKTRATKHVPVLLRHPVAKRVGEPGDTQVCARAFPGIISAWKLFPGELLAYINPRPVAEEGTKANPGGAAEGRRNVGPGAALDAQCATGTAADGFAQVNERAAELGTAAEGDVLAGASIAERMRRLAQWRCLGSLLLIASHISRRGVIMQECVG